MNVVLLDMENREKWNTYTRAALDTDVYFSAEYCRVYEDNGEGKAQLFVYEEGDEFVCYPYLLRDASHLPGLRELNVTKPIYDITTPYGYGGPISNVADADRRTRLFRNFEYQFDAYCHEHRIVSEFVRFHPLLNNWRDYNDVNPEFVRNTVFVDLTLSEEDMLTTFSRDNRNRIRRAQREGFYVTIKEPTRLDNLIRLYDATMLKKQASTYYYFDRNFFQNTTSYLEGYVKLMEVHADDKVIASCLFMHEGDYAHYHLMGSDQAYLKAAPINLLIYEAALWAKSQGFKKLHLGGGVTGNDNLFRFKRSFNEREWADFYVGRRIRHQSLYDAAALILNKQHGIAGTESAYFPMYRNPLLFNTSTESSCFEVSSG
ncbi:GNAT family N-acetyltransferase [Paenibacillus sp. SC116]|uniref:lipid II:glycine glycyltransferase FemX n=1 Tax=Paenibacillus sp. SC116 TaxID=2968986 RepID=UPI00215A984D|nr:GNAT family N-acetyltransferase [Paenibacillus sp. SC116]MCR8844162.1 GNAT family N-acetyltransferase [Paenibacillus sp. SC116]